jgi:hypothetical protein
MKTVIEMAREADVYCTTRQPTLDAMLERFAALVRADEREACAKLVHDNALACDCGSMLQTYLASNAAAIRARGNT